MQRIYLLGIIFFLCVSFLNAEQQAELRGIWITRFEWPDPDPEKCKEKIVRCLDDVANANFNAVFFQIRGEAEVLYPSPLETWSPLIGGKDPGFDPLHFAIEEAHKRNIQFHAYINPIPMILWLEDAKPPLNKDHIFYKHGPNAKDSWVCIDEDGNIMEPKDAAYYYFSPGIPKVQEYLRKVIRDLVTRYNIDGLHLDRIRYPGPQYSHDKISKERFYGNGNPNRKNWQDWQREQLNKFINDVYAETMAIKPKIIVSCASWGIYSRYHVPGYEGFSSGYHDYFQDSWQWIKNGSMDILVPMIYWNIEDPKPNYHELVEDFIKGVGKTGFAGGQRMYGEPWPVEENVRQIQWSREQKIPGTVIFSYESAVQKDAFAILRENVYQEKAPVPLLKANVDKSVILGKVLNSLEEPVCDAWVTLKNNDGQKVSETCTTGSDGRFSFSNVALKNVRLEVTFHNGKTKLLDLEITKKVIEVTITVDTKVSFVPAINIWKVENNGDHCHILGRTSPQNKVTVHNNGVEVASNGMFAMDNIPLNLGKNEIVITAISPDENKGEYVLTVNAVKSEVSSINSPNIDKEELWESFRIAETNEDVTGITYGTHEVRLGGPYIGEFARGTILKLVGNKGKHYKVQLAHSLFGWVEKEKVDLLDASTPLPQAHFTYCSIDGNSSYDTIYIPLKTKIPYYLETAATTENVILLNLFYTHYATTWFTHKNRAQVIGTVTGNQVQENWYQLRIPVKSKQIWGYRHIQNDKGITIFVKRPPILDNKNPLKGLTIALEAGHGGSNLGAMGLTNAMEKDVNRKAVDVLSEELLKYETRIIDLRYRDTYPTHQQRLDRAIAEDADLILSLHANAAATNRGFLRVSGVSTYYKHPHNYLLAKCLWQQLLGLGWQDYGLIANFNYYPLRNTYIPTALIEQGFMTHPHDEAKLLSKQYQQQQAKIIVKGLLDFLETVKE